MEDSSKEYGKLSLEQFKLLVQKLPELRKKLREPPKLLHSIPENEKSDVLGDGLSWSNVYEKSFNEQLALLICALGRAEKLHEAAISDDPVQAAVNLFGNDKFDDFNGGNNSVSQKRNIIGLIIALKRNFLSIMLFDRTLDKLVNEVRSGIDDSLFLAVSIDRSIMACPVIADRIARAELENDENFFHELSNALINGPSEKYWESYKDLRYSFFLLRDSGVDQVAAAQLEDLFVHKLELYSDTPGARRNLRDLFTKSKKRSTASK